MKAYNRKRKPKHATKTKYFLYRITRSIPFCNIYRQKYNYSKKRSCIDHIAVILGVRNIHFCVKRYSSRFALI